MPDSVALSLRARIEHRRALQRRGIESELLYFPDENHWVLNPANSIVWHDHVLDWLNRFTFTSLQERELERLRATGHD